MSVTKAIEIVEKGLTFDIVRQSCLFPPIGVLNSFFQCGVDDAGSEITIRWEPFELSQREYDAFFEGCLSSIGTLKIDGLGFDNYVDWFSAVAARTKNG